MSRVGKNPVVVPQGVTVDLKGQALKVKGKRGELAIVVHDDVEVARTATSLTFKPRSESRRARMQWGTARNLAATWCAASRTASPSTSRSTASATAPRRMPRT
jgi:large subunit ribosomal protein L6